jgi:hypothetical protein
MRRTLLVEVYGIRQVDGSGMSILCNALNVGLQSLPLVTMFFTFFDHWRECYLEGVVEMFMVWPVEERKFCQ